MRPVDNIEKLIKKLRYKPSAETHDRVLRNVQQALENREKQKPADTKPNIWRIIMKNPITKLAAMAVILVAILIGLSILKSESSSVPTFVVESVATHLEGPLTHKFDDGSVVKLAKDARIRLYDNSGKRGFEHVTGEIDVVVAKGEGEFVVTTPLGVVKALGTAFKMDLLTVDSTEVLAVKVKEGSVEVSNAKGSTIVEENQMATVEKDKAPYDFTQDENLPPRLIERIQSMLDAMEAGDSKAWVANFNIKALYDLAKGNIQYSEHRDWFSGMSEDNAENFIEAFSHVQSPAEMLEILAPDIDDNEPEKIYIGSVTLADDGRHATARCVRERGEKQYTIYTPQWTFFDGDWWQTDD